MSSPEYKTVVNQYQATMNFNSLVRYLHGLRFKKIKKLFRELGKVKQGEIITVLDIGCANAKLFGELSGHFHIKYTGIETSSDFAVEAERLFGGLENFEVINDSIMNRLDILDGKDVVVAMETLEHIEEHEVVRLIEAIAKAAPSMMVCSVPVEIGPAIWLKNIGSFLFGYSRHHEYSFMDTLWSGLYMLDKVEPHTIRHKGFDWRWLAQTIRHNLKIQQFSKFPFGWLPAALAFSVYFVAIPRK